MAKRFPDSPSIPPIAIDHFEPLDSVPYNSPFPSKATIERPISNALKTIKHGNLRIAPDGTMTFKKTEAEVLMAAIQLGISHSLAKLHPKPKRDLLVPDFQSVDNVHFPHAGSDNTPGHKYHDFSFKAYSPIAFRHLRDHFTIEPQDFISSLCYYPLRTIGNPGASGSLFYVSQDDIFIIKTVSSKEALFLQKLLPGYWINLHQNKRTLLPKFFGLYSYSRKGTKKIRLVVMNNLLPSNLEFNFKFDLKGSLHGRSASSREISKTHPTFKDNDYLLHFENGIVISPEKYDLLTETIQRDCQVLESFAIMDYSLLVAIHNISKVRRDFDPLLTEYTSPTTEQRATAALRLSLSLDETEILEHKVFAIVPHTQMDSFTHDYISHLPEGYILARLPCGDLAAVYLGIIDILQSYVVKKKLEHTFKSIIYDGDLISVHKPGFYSLRFQNFICTNVITKDTRIRDPKAVNGPSQLQRRKVKRTSVGSRPVISKMQSNEYSVTPPSYPVESWRTNHTKEESNVSHSEQSMLVHNEDELIRYSQLDIENEASRDTAGSSDLVCSTQVDKNECIATRPIECFPNIGPKSTD
ncbi:Phosphatidylinositol 4-phosphate 5-kinase type-1 alpha isoform X16 [Oopsacas minuta]|uniref:Phosphatidylinositol 4-phosphate 5-kinase type-1 alpha isoform X16 n=1 Tax=Oopsacas minuta TaxID=111878 RepID=A0AAV7JIH2_9METZ|nr:Phosphatidylinositol 4-phosphate 5-kinase type-1 alpha isoform X16 [Oopsacas minuta]